MMRTLTNRRRTVAAGAAATLLDGALLLTVAGLTVAGLTAGPAQAAGPAPAAPGTRSAAVPAARGDAATLAGVKARAAAEIAQRQTALSAPTPPVPTTADRRT